LPALPRGAWLEIDLDAQSVRCDGKTVRLWAKDHRGGLAMEATAIVA